MPLKRRAKRGLWVVGIVVAAWYGLNLALPRLGDRRPVLFSRALAGLRAHVLSVCEGHETFGDLAGSATLQWLAKTKVHGDRYILKIVSTESGAPTAIIAYPKKHWGYEYGLLHRVLTLEMQKHSYPTLVLMPDGSVYDNGLRKFDADNAPPDNVLEGLRDSGDWSVAAKYPATPPCSPPKPGRVGG